ncbi:hypothetical protein K0M31_006884 [Melipona bicolor]|uniref:Uncharacterized protein n=1 Tax=Melipona bicolor TaxID=60889 RepID=A0AA40FT67_9HYME|nr:hypothetical protein K0M31_006884 [Melipona bicolor]
MNKGSEKFRFVRASFAREFIDICEKEATAGLTTIEECGNEEYEWLESIKAGRQSLKSTERGHAPGHRKYENFGDERRKKKSGWMRIFAKEKKGKKLKKKRRERNVRTCLYLCVYVVHMRMQACVVDTNGTSEWLRVKGNITKREKGNIGKWE